MDSPAVAAFLPVQIFVSGTLALLLGILILYQKKKQSNLELELFASKDKLAQISEENQILRSKIGKEETKLKELVTNVSHQLKTPLASLKMCYEIADTQNFTKEEQRAFLMQGQQEVNKLDNLIRALVQISRLEANLIQISQSHEIGRASCRERVCMFV